MSYGRSLNWANEQNNSRMTSLGFSFEDFFMFDISLGKCVKVARRQVDASNRRRRQMIFFLVMYARINLGRRFQAVYHLVTVWDRCKSDPGEPHSALPASFPVTWGRGFDCTDIHGSFGAPGQSELHMQQPMANLHVIKRVSPRVQKKAISTESLQKKGRLRC